ncbi:MAG TPA: integrating conjugative element protein [Rhodospirillales bacterium]|nr:integrating conjugative element protein [Rhodospirillales bacterium]
MTARSWFRVVGLCLPLAVLAPGGASAQAVPGTLTSSGDGTFYYRMGGGRPLGDRPASPTATFRLNPSNMLKLPQACSSMDAMASLAELLNLITTAADQAEAIMVYAANAAIAALPAIILQRASPGLYEHFMEAMRRMQEVVTLSAKSCQDMVEDAKAGENPFEDWVKIARRETMKRQIGAATGPVAAQRTVDATNGDAGVPWLGGSAGGVGQPPIMVISDTARAGYNVLTGRPPEATGAPAGAAATLPLVEQWPTVEDAVAWTVRVVGDEEVRTCAGCDAAVTAAGAGLMPDYDQTRIALEPQLRALLDAGPPATMAQLIEVSPPDLLITPQIIEEIRLQFPDPQDRELLVSRLAADIAATKTIERALMARRLLLTGRGVPEIGNVKAAVARIKEAVAELGTEITTLLEEKEFREKAMPRTALVVLAEAANRRQQSLAAAPPAAHGGRPFIGGAIR